MVRTGSVKNPHRARGLFIVVLNINDRTIGGPCGLIFSYCGVDSAPLIGGSDMVLTVYTSKNNAWREYVDLRP